MPKLQVVAGCAGKGDATYEAGALQLPDATVWYAEQLTAVSILGGVDEADHWSGRVLGGLRGGLSLASNLDLTPALGLAASALGAGLGALTQEPKTSAVIEIEAAPHGAIVALAAPGMAALLLHDRETCRRALERGRATASGAEPSPADEGLIGQSRRMIAEAFEALPEVGRLWPRRGGDAG